MPGPVPKPDAIRRNPPTFDWVDLPRDGNQNPVPDWPAGLEAGPDGVAYWGRAWLSPESTQWGEAEIELVARLAQLHDLWVRSLKDEPATKVLPEMRHLETALGRTAKARKELRWRIVDVVQVDESAPAVKPSRRLKVVAG